MLKSTHSVRELLMLRGQLKHKSCRVQDRVILEQADRITSGSNICLHEFTYTRVM